MESSIFILNCRHLKIQVLILKQQFENVKPTKKRSAGQGCDQLIEIRSGVGLEPVKGLFYDDPVVVLKGRQIIRIDAIQDHLPFH